MPMTGMFLSLISLTFKNDSLLLSLNSSKISGNSFLMFITIFFLSLGLIMSIFYFASSGLSSSKFHPVLRSAYLTKIESIANTNSIIGYHTYGTNCTGDTAPSVKPEAISICAP